MKRLTAILALILFPVAASCGGSSSSDDGPAPAAVVAGAIYSNGHPLLVSTTDASVIAKEAEVVTLTNNHRVSIGLNALTHSASSTLSDLARGHSTHMFVHVPNFFNHDNPEGYSVDGRFNLAGITWTMVGENIAGGYPTATDAFNGWMASAGHKANIERVGWTQIGVGYAYGAGSTYGHYWSQEFLRP